MSRTHYADAVMRCRELEPDSVVVLPVGRHGGTCIECVVLTILRWVAADRMEIKFEALETGELFERTVYADAPLSTVDRSVTS